MDERFPRYVRVIVRRLSFLSIPNLGMLMAGFGVLGFMGHISGSVPMDRFVFDPYLFMQGEWWRLLTFPVAEAPSSPIWLLFYVLFVYYIMNGLEEGWGVAPLTVFTLFSYLACLGSTFYAGGPIRMWQFVIENIMFAYSTLYPDMTFHIFGIFPVKAKWLGMIYGAIALLGFFNSPVLHTILYSPYLFFFGPYLYSTVRYSMKNKARKSQFDRDMWK